MTMTADEARARFDDALDDELSDEEKAAFHAALEAEPVLAAEYAEMQDVLRTVGALGRDEAVAAPDLLHGVQERLRKRSRGRYYRDRFAERGPGLAMPILLILTVVLLLALAWLSVEAGLLVGNQ